MTNSVKKIIILAVIALFVSACTTRTVTPVQTDTVAFTDGLGRSVQIPVKVDRAISLAPSLTETVFAIGAGDRLVGVTSYCNYPEAASSIEKVGDTMTPNIERIIALKPQLVLVSTASQLESFMETLAKHNIAVFVTAPTDMNGVIKDMKTLGTIFGTTEKAETVTTEMTQRINKVKESVVSQKQTKVFLQISNEPLFTIGKDSFLNEVIETTGGISVTREVETAYPKLSKETAAAMDPEVIILSESDDNREPNTAFKNSAAVKNGRVFKINADIISRPGPRTADALEQISKILRQD